MPNKPHRYQELADFVLAKAIKRGRFTLASGETSDYYCDGKLATFDPEGANLVADAVLDAIKGFDATAIGGLEMGAIPIVTAVAMRSYQLQQPIQAFVVRKEMKGHGTRKLIEGPIPDAPARVVVVDDVVTKGGSILEAINVVRDAGHEVVLALSVLDREQGGAEVLMKAGVRYQPLLRISEVMNAADFPTSIASRR